MHIADFSIGMLGANGVVADGVTIAVGAAQAIKVMKQDRVALAFFGDGAVNRGPLMEALNWAKIYNLPMLFVCENNGYAATTRTRDVTAGEGFVPRAQSFGIEGEILDGNDVRAVDAAAGSLVAAARAGGGPKFLFANTYRHHPHNLKDAGNYRTADEIAGWKRKDPITRTEAFLLEQGVGQSDIAAVVQEARSLIGRAVEAAHAAPWPPASAAYTDVQDFGAPCP